MTWDATWWWFVAYVAVGFVVAVITVKRCWDLRDPMSAAGAMILWPLVIICAAVWGLGVLIVVMAQRR